ncbi:hypothetical protein E1B28_010767 [Marasmius oreades]|uniref:Uncharacterized protein n=1 Tax=Marasmius oreades TaxID=181124 RepID=A0A9P7UNU9_9AGAR|nr:uncharacterized protein E1B28_010767 [Marasmius oreades]KAG7089057.1 hypothetical protein E1B28_010767 [Marasmius oreades]
MANAVSGEAAFALLLDSPSFPLPPGITPGSAASKVVFDKMVQALEHQRIVSYLDGPTNFRRSCTSDSDGMPQSSTPRSSYTMLSSISPLKSSISGPGNGHS